jgi:hypothetical protein
MVNMACQAGDGSSSWKEWYVSQTPHLITAANELQISGAISILCFIFLVDFPDRASRSWKFLNEAECAFIVRRIENDRKDGHLEAFSLKKFLKPALDPKIWAFAMIFL